ncbi:hypothetical protein BFR04_08855 [Gaetbulibacter sp. 4G1]|nr:glycosyltransferase family 4 protein [Gaetbulibacter sp. 4G1]PIA77538.1 hypothetical protein BFR04_08855 [Gaetbulibacter sp. 4G1]
MKIVYYTDQIHLHGGIERVLTNKANYWVNKKGYETHIITSEQKNNPPRYPLDKRVHLHDLAINYNRKLSYFNQSNFKKAFKHYFILKKKLREIKPDVIIVCNFAFDFYFIPFIFPSILKIKEFHSSRSFDNLKRKKNKSFLKYIYYAITDYIESKYDYIALLTVDEIKYYKSNNTIVIPNALSNYPEEVALLDEKKVISAGRIAPVKGFEKLIEAWVFIKDKMPEWVLEIYGSGEKQYLFELQNQINISNLQDRIILCGNTDSIELKMKDSSIFVMSSLTECFPMVLLESLSCGLPVVSFDCPNGPRNIITNNEDGYLVENQNSKDLANSLIRLMKDEKLRKAMGKKGKSNMKKYHPDIVMNLWEKIFIKKY